MKNWMALGHWDSKEVFQGGQFLFDLVYLIHEIMSKIYTYIEKRLNLGKERNKAKKVSPANIFLNYQEDINPSVTIISLPFFSKSCLPLWQCAAVPCLATGPSSQSTAGKTCHRFSGAGQGTLNCITITRERNAWQ